MEFADSFAEEMEGIITAHNNKLAGIKTNMMKAIDDRDSFQTNADKELKAGNVSAVVENRIMAENKDKEYGVYSDLMKAAENEMLISAAKFNEYVQQITTEYGRKEYQEYQKLADALKNVWAIIDEIHGMNVEAHYCMNKMETVIAQTGSTDRYYKSGENPFVWEFTITPFIENPLRSLEPMTMIKNNIEKYKKYAEV